MALPSPAPLELDNIPLPPIPGPLPPTFFTETPVKSLAVFSTRLSARPFRHLPNPVPPLVIRSASHNDVESKAWSLLHTYPEVAESIFTPPAAWSDLYHYFDSMDLWTEGAGFLFHVLGYLVRVNWTRFNCLRNYADQWALTHEMRLLAMPILQPDLLSSVFTAEDDAWFDVGNLTEYQKNALAVVLNSHRGILQAKRDSLGVARRTNTARTESQNRRSTDLPSLEPLDHQERPRTPPFKSASQKLSGASPSFVPTKVTAQQQPINQQSFKRSTSHNTNASIFHASTKSQVFMREAAISGKVESSGPYMDRRLNSPKYGFRNFFGSQGGPRNAYVSGASQTHFQRTSEPVYVFNGQNSTIHPKHEVPSTSDRPYVAPYPTYHVKQQPHINIQEKSPPDPLKKIRRFKNARAIPNDARVYYEGGFAQLQDEGVNFQGQNAVPPDDSRDTGCTVFVGGLPFEALENEFVRELFSKCGAIKGIKTLLSKGCCFVEFANPQSAAHAINSFHRYVTEYGVLLTVQHAKSRGKNVTHKREALSQSWQFKATSPPSYQIADSNRRVTERPSSSYSPRGSTPSSTNSNPPHRLPPKPHSQSFTGFDSQINFVERLIQTAASSELPAHLNSITASVDELKSDGLGRIVCGPQNKLTISSKKKKNYKRKSESPNSSPTHTMRKQPLNDPSKDPAIADSPQNVSSFHRVDSHSLNSSLVILQSSGNAEITSSHELSQDQNASTMCDLMDLKENQCTSQLGNKTEAMTRPDGKPPNTLNQNLSDAASVRLMKTFSDLGVESAHMTESVDLAEVAESLAQSGDSTTLVEIKPNRKTYNTNKKSPGKFSKAGKGTIRDITVGNCVLAEETAKQGSEGSVEICSKIKINKKTSTTSPFYDAQPMSEKTSQCSEIDKKTELSPHNTTQGMSTPPSGHSRQKSRGGKRPSQPKIDTGDDIFSNCTSTAAQDRRKPAVATQATFKTNSSPRSSRTPGSAKKVMTQAQDESPTPKGTSRSFSRRKPSQTNVDGYERKENIQLSHSAILLLSDLSEWPALGTGKVQLDLKSTKSLAVRSPKPRSIRRDSLVSNVSSASPQPVRRLTTTAASPPSSCGSPLWPVVKRWDISNPSTKRV